MMKSRTMDRARLAPAGIAPRAIALTALCLLALSGIATTAARAEDDNSGLFGTMMRSFGLSNKTIEYRERPPLQVPQTRDLPPPGSAAPAPSGAPVARSDRMSDLDRLAVPQRAAPPDGTDATASVPQSAPNSSPGFFGRLFNSGSSQQTVAPAAPTRNTLLEPPPGYESASPAAPYGTDGKESLGKKSASDKPVSGGGGQ